MTKLTPTQLQVLTSASRQEAGLATRPDKLNTTAAAKVTASLIDKGLVRECAAKAGWPVWRKDEAGKSYSLKILKAGRALAAVGTDSSAGHVDGQKAATAQLPGAIQPAPASQPNATAAQPAPDAPRAASKIAGILGLLAKAEGATAVEMIAVTGWLPHTLRAAMTGLRKRGYPVERTRKPSGTTAYKLGSAAVTSAAS